MTARGPRWAPAAATAAAVILAFGLSAVLILATGGSATAAVRSIWQGSLASQASWTSTLLYTAPLLMVAVGTCVSARAGVFNIGQEGQVLIGATAGAAVALRLAVTGPALVTLALLAAAAAGGAWAGISAVLLRARGVNVVVSTLLLTFVAQQVVSYAVSTPWLLQESVGSGIASSQSNPLPASARLPTFGAYPELQVNVGLVLAAGCAVLAAVALARTRWGFQLRLTGLNAHAARHAGVRVTVVSGLALAASGALAGLAGATVLTSPISTGRLDPGVSNNIGWDGLLVALVARSRPAATVPVALAFGMLRAGGDFLAATGVPSYLVDVIKALLVLAFMIPPALLDGWRRRRRAAPTPRAPLPPIDAPVEVSP